MCVCVRPQDTGGDSVELGVGQDGGRRERALCGADSHNSDRYCGTMLPAVRLIHGWMPGGGVVPPLWPSCYRLCPMTFFCTRDIEAVAACPGVREMFTALATALPAALTALSARRFDCADPASAMP